jgi:opacity protein-like surface antigen
LLDYLFVLHFHLCQIELVMKTAAFCSALAGALFLAATLAVPQDGGFYLAAGTMATFAGPHDFEIGPKPADDDAELTVSSKTTGTFDIGILGFRAAVGFRFLGFRPEAEISFRQLGLADFEYSSFSPGGIDLPETALTALNDSIDVKAGSLVLLGAIANLWFDIDTGGSPLMPYLGGGVGIGRITLDSRTDAEFSGVSVDQEFPESSAEAFAFQAGAGLGYDLGAGFILRIGYRLFGTTEAQLAWNALDSDTNDVLKAEILLHNIDLGLSYQF